MNKYFLKSREISVLLFLCLLLIGCVDSATNPRKKILDPSFDFMEYTNLSWPEGATVIFSGDVRSLNGDGEFFVVFATDEDTINKFLSNPAPFSDSWEKGPVSKEFAFKPRFGYEEYDTLTVVDGVTYAGIDPGHHEAFFSEEIYFSAQERCCDSIRWHNGDIIVIDPRSNKVWLSIWDF